MSTKALQAKVIIEKPEQLTVLWQVHSVFNQYLSEVIQKLFEMKRSQWGTECKSVADAIYKSQQAIGRLEAITKPEWKTKKTTNPDAQAYIKVKPLIDRLKQKIGDWLTPTNLDDWIKTFNQHSEIINWRCGTHKLNPFPNDELQKIEKVKIRAENQIKKPKSVAGKKKPKSWQERKLWAFLKANPEIKVLDKTMKEYQFATSAQGITQRPFNYKDWNGFAQRIHRKIYEEAQMVISGFKALVKNWEDDHNDWLKDKKKWEEEHQSYINTYRQRFLDFEKEVRGKISPKRRRWRIYLDWFKKNPDLAAWRGKPDDVKPMSVEGSELTEKEAKQLNQCGVVNPIPPKGLERIKKAYRRKKIAKEFEEFFKVNPELKVLDEAHKTYEENFVRRRAKKRHKDGFRHYPTFTMPSIIRHPRWFNFQRDVGYKNLDIKNGSIMFTIPVSGNTEKSFIWAPYKFKSDQRLNLFHEMSKEQAERFAQDYKFETFRVDNQWGVRRDKQHSYTYYYTDEQLVEKNGKPLERPAQIKGIKLRFRPAQPDGAVYLDFTCDIPDLPLSKSATKYRETGKTAGLVTCAVDLGIHHIAVASIRRNGEILRTRVIWDEDLNPTKGDKLQSGPSLKHIDQHKYQLKRLRRLRGRPVKDEESCVELQEHTTNMSEDRFKKAARKIVNFALNRDGYIKTKDGKGTLSTPIKVPPADILILENLKTFTTSAEREQGVNTALTNWSKGHIVEWTKRLAKDAGLYASERSSYYTSQICSKCGSLGRRYSLIRNKDSEQIEVRFGGQRSRFGCPKDGCLLGINADYNASLNIHKIFYDDFPKPKKIKDGIYSVNNKEVKLDEIDRAIKKRLADKGLIPISHEPSAKTADETKLGNKLVTGLYKQNTEEKRLDNP